MLVYDTKYTFSHILTGESYSLLIIKKAIFMQFLVIHLPLREIKFFNLIISDLLYQT